MNTKRFISMFLLPILMVILEPVSSQTEIDQTTSVDLGCYYTSNIVQYFSVGASSYDGLTREYCAKLCIMRGLAYGLTFFSYLCGCVESISSFILLPDSYCFRPCTGNLSTYCGGESGNLYNIYGTLLSQSPNQQINCALYSTDSFSTLNRTLVDAASIDLCLQECYNLNLRYAVLFYNCYCSDNDLSSYLTITPPVGFCGYSCASDQSQYCGGMIASIFSITNVTDYIKRESFVEYQGTFSLASAIRSTYLFRPEEYSMSMFSRLCMAQGYQYVTIDNINGVLCFSNISLLTQLPNNTTPRRWLTDLSYYDGNNGLEVYALKPFPTNFDQNVLLPNTKYIDCYINASADAIYETNSMNSTFCNKFCFYLGYQYSATRENRCNCGYQLFGVVSGVTNCSGSNDFRVYQLLEFQMSIACSASQVTVNEGINCTLNLYNFMSTNLSIDFADENLLTYSNINSGCSVCNKSIKFNLQYSSSGTYLVKALAFDNNFNQANTSILITVLASKANTGNYKYKKYKNAELQYIEDNLIRTSLAAKRLKCGSLCNLYPTCAGFSYKSDLNCSLFVSLPNNASLYDTSATSTWIYIKTN